MLTRWDYFMLFVITVIGHVIAQVLYPLVWIPIVLTLKLFS